MKFHKIEQKIGIPKKNQVKFQKMEEKIGPVSTDLQINFEKLLRSK